MVLILLYNKIDMVKRYNPAYYTRLSLICLFDSTTAFGEVHVGLHVIEELIT